MALTYQGAEGFGLTKAFGASSALGCSAGTCGLPVTAESNIMSVNGPHPGLDKSDPSGWEESGALYSLTVGPYGDDIAIIPTGTDSPTGRVWYTTTDEFTFPWDTHLVGAWVEVGALGSNQTIVSVGEIGWTDPAGEDASCMLLRVNPTGKYEVVRYLQGNLVQLLATSVEDAVVGWQQFEFGVYFHASNGAFDVKVNGNFLTWDNATSGMQTTDFLAVDLYSMVYDFTSPTTRIAHPYFFAGNGGFVAGDFKTSPGNLVRTWYMTPAGPGTHNDFSRYTGEPVTLIGAGNSLNWEYVSDAPSDGPMTFLRGTGASKRQSVMLAGLSSSALSVINVMLQVTTGKFQANGYQFDNYPEADEHYELYFGGVPFNNGAENHFFHADNFDSIDAGQGILSRPFTVKPDGSGAWAPSDLTGGIEAGVSTDAVSVNIDIVVSSIALLVLGTTSAPVPPVVDEDCPTGPETGACDVKSDAWFVDAGKKYDGRDEDGSALTFADLGSGTDSGDTVAINVDLTGTFEAGDVGKRIRLTIAGVNYDATVTTVIGTRGIEATLLQDVPLSAVGVSTTNWSFVTNTLNMPWLALEQVNVLADGIPLYVDSAKPPTKYTVAFDGTLTLNAYYGVIIAGLPRISDAELLDLDADGGAVFRDRKKLTGKVALLVEFTRQFSIGQEASMTYTQLAHEWVEPIWSGTNPLALHTRTAVVNAPTRRDVPGRLLIRQYEPLPISLLGVIHEVDVGGRSNV